MDKLFYRDLKLGILGGGQLGRMFVAACQQLNVHTSVLDTESSGGPAGSIANRFVAGDFTRYEDVVAFGSTVDVLTVEIESVNVPALYKLVQAGVRVHPQPEVLELVQDKGLQKQFYTQQGIPTAPYQLVPNRAALQALNPHLPAILKLRQGGYDGKGVKALTTPAHLQAAWDAPMVLESQVAIAQEVAVIVARSATGALAVYPVVQMAFNPTAHLVEYLFCPANLNPQLQQQAQQLACTVAEKLNIIGLLAVELFVTNSGELLVNEVAPRPHNSGHATLEANQTSQFEQHLRAILGLPLGDTALKMPAVMVNLLGAAHANGPPRYQGIEQVLALPGACVHLYGKHQTRPMRKMGHVTVTDASLEKALATARAVQQLVQVTV